MEMPPWLSNLAVFSCQDRESLWGRLTAQQTIGRGQKREGRAKPSRYQHPMGICSHQPWLNVPSDVPGRALQPPGERNQSRAPRPHPSQALISTCPCRVATELQCHQVSKEAGRPGCSQRQSASLLPPRLQADVCLNYLLLTATLSKEPWSRSRARKNV